MLTATLRRFFKLKVLSTINKKKLHRFELLKVHIVYVIKALLTSIEVIVLNKKMV